MDAFRKHSQQPYYDGLGIKNVYLGAMHAPMARLVTGRHCPIWSPPKNRHLYAEMQLNLFDHHAQSLGQMKTGRRSRHVL